MPRFHVKKTYLFYVNYSKTNALLKIAHHNNENIDWLNLLDKQLEIPPNQSQ